MRQLGRYLLGHSGVFLLWVFALFGLLFWAGGRAQDLADGLGVYEAAGRPTTADLFYDWLRGHWNGTPLPSLLWRVPTRGLIVHGLGISLPLVLGAWGLALLGAVGSVWAAACGIGPRFWRLLEGGLSSMPSVMWVAALPLLGLSFAADGRLLWGTVILSFGPAAAFHRTLTVLVETNLAAGHYRMAQACGISRSRFVVDVLLKQAPFYSLMMSRSLLGGLFSTGIFVETLMHAQGLGRLLVAAALGRDLPVLLDGGLVFLAVVAALRLLLQSLLLLWARASFMESLAL